MDHPTPSIATRIANQHSTVVVVAATPRWYTYLAGAALVVAATLAALAFG